MDKRLDINPQTKIGEMLDAYPMLEDVLIKLSPSFAKLKNPIMRKTVGRIATLRQVAEIGGLNIGEMISTLRKAAGIDSELSSASINIHHAADHPRPEWADINNISVTFDATPIIESGGSPMKEILNKAGTLETGEAMLLIAPFKPTPIIELLGAKGYISWNEEIGDKVHTYLKKEK